MARAAVQRRLTWRLGGVIRRIEETPHMKTLMLAVPGWPGHQAGQQVDVGLTSPDWYPTERSYSITSAPEDADQVAFTVDERLEGGEVSPSWLTSLKSATSSSSVAR
jgi:ferredoxin-NADP reductase